MKNIDSKKIKHIISLVCSVLMCTEGFLLFFSHITNGETHFVAAGFAFLYYGIPVVLSVLGLILILMNSPHSRNDLLIVIASLVYLLLRIASGAVNDLFIDVGYLRTLCYEALLVVGINAFTFNRKTLRILFCGLLSFDLIAISICTYHYLYLRDSMASAVASFPAQLQGFIPFTFIFVNPNLAGMLAGICGAACILIFTDLSKNLRLLLVPVIIINICFMLWSDSRTSIIGTVLIIVITVLRRVIKSINYKAVIAGTLVVCVLFMMPVYIMVLTSDHTEHFSNTETETRINEASSGRYNIWKSHILSQRGHYLLGFGTPSKAIIERNTFLESINENEDVEMDSTYQSVIGATSLGSHNGYLELVLAAGMPAFLIIMALLLLRIRSMDNSFIDQNPVILLLIMLFWICVQESRFITSSVHYIAFIMMLLLSWRDDGNKEKTT